MARLQLVVVVVLATAAWLATLHTQSTAVHAATILVDASQPGGIGCGSAGNQCRTLAEAFTEASASGDVIQLAAGQYPVNSLSASVEPTFRPTRALSSPKLTYTPPSCLLQQCLIDSDTTNWCSQWCCRNCSLGMLSRVRGPYR